MPLYDYRCPQGHAFEQMAAITARAQQDCPVCGQASGKVPSRVSLGGKADPGLAMDQMPQTWRGTYEGNPEYVGQLRGSGMPGRNWRTNTRSCAATAACARRRGAVSRGPPARRDPLPAPSAGTDMNPSDAR